MATMDKVKMNRTSQSGNTTPTNDGIEGERSIEKQNHDEDLEKEGVDHSKVRLMRPYTFAVIMIVSM